MGVTEKKVSFGETRRKLIIEHGKRVVKDKTPMHIEKLLSWIELEVGIKRDNAKSIVVILHDTEIIDIDNETGMVYWGKRPKITQGKQENTGGNGD